jgi:integrase
VARPSEYRLTDRTVRALPVPATGTRKYRDRDLTGFAIQVTAAGHRAFCLIYRLGGRERLYTIGAWPAWTATAACEEAKKLRRMVDDGIDPHDARDAEDDAPTVADLLERYEQDHLPRKAVRSHSEDKALGRILAAKLGEAKVAAVRHQDVDRLHREITRAGTPIRANRVASLGSRLWSLALRWGWAESNVWQGIERNAETRRQRYLTPAELQRLGAVLDAHPEQQSANAIRLLLLTGARRGEVLGATWDQFDLERGVWTKPSAQTKTRKEHRVPLSAPALQILIGMQAKAGDRSPYLLPGTTPDKHQTDLKHFWASVCKRAGIAGARVHDLRHTHASILASSGLSLPIIGAMLGHTQPGTTARYSHLMDDPLRAAAEKVGAVWTGSGESSAEVVPLRRGA